MEDRTKAALTLSLLSPVFGELVSGSSPPFEFFNPVSFLFLWGLYGGGVLILRDLWVRWGKGYTRLMVLGITYGIMEEGLAIKSFFDPGWMDLGIYSTYGRFAGVNFGWAFWLMAFHAIYSITVPVLLVEALYPQYSRWELLTARTRRPVVAAFLLSASAMFFGLNPYVPPALPYLGALIAVVFLLRWSRRHAPRRVLVMKRFAGRPLLRSAVLSSLVFINFVFLPSAGIPAPLVCLTGFLALFSLFSSMEMTSPVDILSSAIGLLLPILLFYDIVLELNGVIGMALVSAVTLVLLLRLRKKMSTSASAPEYMVPPPQKI